MSKSGTKCLRCGADSSWIKGRVPNEVMEDPKPSAPVAGDAITNVFGETTEEYFCKRDDFVRYIADEVNPARVDAGLAPLDMKTAEECFRIINDFARKWIKSPPQPTIEASTTPPP